MRHAISTARQKFLRMDKAILPEDRIRQQSRYGGVKRGSLWTMRWTAIGKAYLEHLDKNPTAFIFHLPAKDPHFFADDYPKAESKKTKQKRNSLAPIPKNEQTLSSQEGAWKPELMGILPNPDFSRE